MAQDSIIAFALLAGFLVYITMRGELGTYAGFIEGVKPTKPA
jgi:hypothetical protein